MTDPAARHARVKACFLDLRELPPDGREEALAAIEDPRVRQEVASLLVCDGAPVDLLAADSTERAPLTLAAERPPPPLAGALLCERFEVQSALAEGGFGWVFRGRDRQREEAVAVKLFKPIADPRLAAQAEAAFLREGQALGELARSSAHIVAYRDAGVWRDGDGRGHHFIVMEWLEGPTLHAYAAKRRAEAPLSFEDAAALLAPIAEALAMAHARGIAHRDLKPANILCVGDLGCPTLKLVDFGAAKLATERARGFESTGAHLGMVTLDHAAPEQLSKELGPTGPWSDVHALALLLVELALGRAPLGGPDVISTMYRIMDPSDRPTPRRLGIAVDDAVEAVMQRALAVDTAVRHRDARAFWDELSAALAEEAPAARPAPRSRRRGLRGLLTGRGEP
ncbi:MAG: serine/threonine protein kinase [Deltaproteobacteria bacterium]|nr:serine/threonine protein kinase [Deltaproteobacteria bacterium]